MDANSSMRNPNSDPSPLGLTQTTSPSLQPSNLNPQLPTPNRNSSPGRSPTRRGFSLLQLSLSLAARDARARFNRRFFSFSSSSRWNRGDFPAEIIDEARPSVFAVRRLRKETLRFDGTSSKASFSSKGRLLVLESGRDRRAVVGVAQKLAGRGKRAERREFVRLRIHRRAGIGN